MFKNFSRKRRVKLQKKRRRGDAMQYNRGLGRTLRHEPLEDRRMLALIGVEPLSIPTFGYDFGAASYDSGANVLSIAATPTDSDTEAVNMLPPSEGTFLIGDLLISIEVDESGNLVGGVPGDDLLLTGVLDRWSGNPDLDHPLEFYDSNDGNGPLLTAEIVAFGHQESGVTDEFDFEFVITGGQLAFLFPDTRLGMTLNSTGSFTGDFNVSFGGDASGRLGALSPVVGGTAAIHGMVWEDFNNDGAVNFNEAAIEGVTIQLLDGNGVVIDTTTTDEQGLYSFVDLEAGTYGIMELQPAGFADGLDVVGEIDGSPVGDASVNDKITGIVLADDDTAVNYNFGERPEAGGTISAGQTAGIGFWQNKNGQNLIKSVNEGLGDWLAATFPNIYGNDGDGDVNPFDLTGKTNAEVAEFYKTEFKRRTSFLQGPPKLNSQVLATALAVYVTNSNLAGLTGLDYGFSVSETGLGTSTFNVGYLGAVFGVDNHTDITVLDALFAVDGFTQEGLLYDDYDMDSVGDGHINLGEWVLRLAADVVFWSINEGGSI